MIANNDLLKHIKINNGLDTIFIIFNVRFQLKVVKRQFLSLVIYGVMLEGVWALATNQLAVSEFLRTPS